MVERAAKPNPRMLGRYLLFGEIASGGMATVHIGRLMGPAGFSRTVAIKKLHPQFAKDPEFVSMFLDEARLAARIRHPNVVSTLDVVALEGELFLVMDYVQGASLSQLLGVALRAKERIPPQVISRILTDTLLGLHAAHEATNDHGYPLGLVHRDMSPQNILVGADGIARVVDFGVAKAASRAQITREGQIKGKLSYMAPEQLQLASVDRRTDVFAAAVVLWEALAGRRLFASDDSAAVVAKILTGELEPPSRYSPGLCSTVDDLVLRGLARSPVNRFASARDMARALEQALPPAGSLETGEWVSHVAAELLKTRSRRLAEVEASALPPQPRDGVTLVDSQPGASVPDGTPARGTSPSLAEILGNESVSQSVTNLSLVSTPIDLPTPRKRKLRIGAAAAAVVLCGVVAAVSLRAPDQAAANSPARAANANPRPLPAVNAAPPAAPSAKPVAASLPAPPAATSAAAPQASSTAPVSGARRASALKTPNPSPKARKPQCSPPYVLNPDGTKRFKPECF
jgi:eukaryotic-like serine/threonine-protein kinase